MLSDLVPKTNVWLEMDGEVALSRWRADLLLAVHQAGSISSAAEALGIQYRLAWQRIHEMEERLGVSLVESRVGGKGGGGATLTPFAHQLIERFALMADAVELAAAAQGQAFIQHFALMDEDNQYENDLEN